MKTKKILELQKKAEQEVARLRAKGWKQKNFASALKKLLK